MWTSTLTHKLGRFGQTMRQQGHRAAVRLVVDRVGQRLLNASVMYVLRLSSRQTAVDSPANPGLVFRFLSSDELWRFSTDPENNLSPAVVGRALQGSDSCFAALDGKRLAAHGWYARNSIQAEHAGGIAMSFPPQMAYVYRVFTHPDFRGQRLNGLTMSLALHELGAEGIEELIATVDWTNWASLRSFQSLGCNNLGPVVTFGPSWRQAIIPPQAATHLGLRFGRQADLSNRR